MILVDTSAWIHALRPDGDPGIRNQVDEMLRTGNACWCAMVRLELWSGARGRHEKKVLGEMERILPDLEIDAAVWNAACALAANMRGEGLTIPAADLLIAACALRHGVRVLHDDRHFEALPRHADRRD